MPAVSLSPKMISHVCNALFRGDTTTTSTLMSLSFYLVFMACFMPFSDSYASMRVGEYFIYR